MGPTTAEEGIYPIRDKLCDYVVYTHVTLTRDAMTAEDGISSYELFKKVNKTKQNKYILSLTTFLLPPDIVGCVYNAPP